MICKNCPEGRMFTDESVNCIHYGMIIRADHECKLERGMQLDRAIEDNGQDGENGTEIQDHSGGAA